MKMPVLFIEHGSPEDIILKNSFTQRLAALGQELPRPRAIPVISAPLADRRDLCHWRRAAEDDLRFLRISR